MLSMKQLVILAAIVSVVCCAQFHAPAGSSKSQTKEGFCEKEGVFIKQGESAQIGEECLNHECESNYSITTSR